MASNLMRLSRKALSPQGWQRIKGHLQKGIYFSLNYMLWSILYEVFWKINPYSCVSRFLCRRKEH